MLDTKTNLVLKIIQRECKNGGYKIVDKNDIISALPNKFRCDIDELDHITSYLERQDYISIKYDDDIVYCLCILPTANEILSKNGKSERKNKPYSWFWVFLLAFLGSFLGCFIASLLVKYLL